MCDGSRGYEPFAESLGDPSPTVAVAMTKSTMSSSPCAPGTPTAAHSWTASWRTAIDSSSKLDTFSPAPPDRVLEPIDQEVVAGFVDPKRVAGVEPPVAPDLGRRYRRTQVPGAERPRRGGARDQLAHFARPDVFVVRVHDADLGPGIASHALGRTRSTGRGRTPS